MKSRVILAALLLLWGAKSACAHRLDEYLQATMIDVAGDHVSLNMRLAPGVEVFSQVLAKIDTDGDGTISAAEQRAYAESVVKDLSLSIDGQRLPLSLDTFTFPELGEMKQGIGEILLNFAAKAPVGSQNRTLVFENRHLPAISVYLANCLIPSNPDIRVVTQNRNVTQSLYQLDYTLGNVHSKTPPVASAPTFTSWLASTGSESVFKAFFYQGIRHILTGYDHLLFVTALVLAATTLWDLIKVVSTFTLAHTITLTLAAMNLIHLPERVVEPLISASIVFVAIQNVFWPRQARGWSRLGAAFFFGLFHGLGFAGGLLDAMREMQSGMMFLAILAFSIGIETGHQMVVLPLFAALKTVRSAQSNVVARTNLSMMIQRIGSAGISAAGIYYLCVALACRS
jgi:hydrogenase/urease accessory protein HupE